MYQEPQDQIPLPSQSAPPSGPKGRRRATFGITVVVTLTIGVAIGHYVSPAKQTTTLPANQAQATTAPPSQAASPDTGKSSAVAIGPTGTPTTANPNGYTTTDPFPLCDRGGASWTLTGVESESSGSACSSGNTPITVTQDGTYGFVSANGFPGQPAISPTNTVKVTGTLPGLPGYHDRCLGVAEGDSQTVYFGYICNSGQWSISKLASFGVQGSSLGPNLAQGTFPFGASEPYSVAIGLQSGQLTLTIALASSTTSPLTHTLTIPALTPTTVGIGYGGADPTLPINPSDFYGTVSQFSYTIGSGS